MKNSSAQLRKELQIDYSDSSQQSALVFSQDAQKQADYASDVAFFSSAGQRDGVNSALTARIAGRMNASLVSESEEAELLRKRSVLLDRKFSGDFSRSDEIKLEYVRWNLDRIDDARHGTSLDQLEILVSHYEDIRKEINDLKSALKSVRK